MRIRKGGTGTVGQVDVYNDLVIIRVFGKTDFFFGFPSLVILLGDTHDILGAVRAFAYLYVRHRPDQCACHRTRCGRLGLARCHLFHWGRVLIYPFDVILHQTTADRKVTGGFVTVPIGILHVQTIFVIYFLCHIAIL